MFHKMLSNRKDVKNKCHYSSPCTKLRNIFCTQCSRQFFLEEFVPLRGSVPLLLQCGHVICDKCKDLIHNKPCLQCETSTLIKINDKASVLPLNMYTLGAIIMSQNRPLNTDDLDVSFSKPLSFKSKQTCAKGLCHECGLQAAVRCQECLALYCFICYSKIHGRALQCHTKVMLSNGEQENQFTVVNTCSEQCKEPLGYYCDDCKLAGCSHCMLQFHNSHNYQSLLKKNEVYLEEFRSMIERVRENLLRIRQAQKKLKTTARQPTETQNIDNIEAKVTQHFAYLHGVLQNLEQKIIESLRNDRNSNNTNFDETLTQLNEQEERLHFALTIAESISKNLDKIDVQQVIEQLEPLVNIPCHLVVNTVVESQEIRLDIDKSIVQALENHCNVRLPSSSNFSLKRADSLPDDYETETLSDETDISSSSNIPDQDITTQMEFMTMEPVSSNKNKSFPAVGSSETVHVSHIYDPSCFYVQPIQNRNKLTKLNSILAGLAKTSAVVPTEVTLNGLYIGQYSNDKLWYRARVTNKKMNSAGDEVYEVFFIDYGMTDDNVPLSRLRNISPRYTMFPPMALKCTLHDIVPSHGNWHPDAINAFKNLVCTNVMNSICVMMITADTYYVDLCVISARDSRVISVKDSLTYMKYATCTAPNKLMKTNLYSTTTYYREQLKLKTYTRVDLLYIESPYSIYVQKEDANRRSYFVKMMNEMLEDYEKNISTTKFISAPCKDLPCAARGIDGYWHRGLIIEVTENTAKVFYVDMGYTMILSHDAIRALPKKYMSRRAQAIRISLKDVKPQQDNEDQWESEATKFLKSNFKYLSTVEIIAFDIIDYTYDVVMYTLDRKNVAHFLTENSLKCNQELRQRKNNRFRKNINNTEISGEPYDNPSNTSIGSSYTGDNEDPFKISVVVHHVLSPDCIYVSDVTYDQSDTTHDQSDAEQMMKEAPNLDKYHHFTSPNTWNEDTICAVYSTKTHKYHRARINNIKSSNEAVVFFYDLGIEETVPLKYIQLHDPKFSKTSTAVFKVKLTGILPCGGSNTWPSLSCEKLRNIIINNQNCKFYISKLEKEDIVDSTIPVELWIKQRKMDGPLAPTRHEINSVNRMLVEEGVALPVKEYAMRRDRILAIELKRQLLKKMERLTNCEINTCFEVNNMLEGSVETSIHKEISNTLYNSDDESDSQKYNIGDMYDNFPSLPKLSEWLPVTPITEDTFIAIPTYLDHDGFLYLHCKAQNARMIEYIEMKLEMIYNNCPIESCDTVWAAGDMCIAKYHGNNKWYRGKVVKVQGNDTVQVEFVDYGNVEECSIEVMRKKVVLEDIPIQCTKCMIYGLIPATENGIWLSEDLDRIHHLLVERECEVTVINRTETHLIIHLTIYPSDSLDLKCDVISFLINTWNMNIKHYTEITMSEKSVCATNTLDTVTEISEKLFLDSEVKKDSIISENSMQFLCTDDVTNNEGDIKNLSPCEINDEITTSTLLVTSKENFSLTYKMANIPKDVEYIEIELCCSISLTEFHAQLTENTHSTTLNKYHMQYVHLMTELQENACKQTMITTFAPNTPCCAKFDDNLWYRCLITECEHIKDSDDIAIQLLYVDYGNNECRTVNAQQCELYSLKEEWFDVPIIAIKCILWNVEVPHTANYNELLPRIQEMYNKRVVATIKEIGEEFISVELYENSDSKEVIYNTLIEEGLFIIKSDNN